MSGSTLRRTAQWLYSRLASDSTLQGLPSSPPTGMAALGNPMRLYRRQAPQAPPSYPVLVLQTQSALDRWGLGFCHLPTPFVVSIRGVVKGSSDAPLWDALDRVDALLTGNLGTIGDGSVLWGARDSEFEYAEDVGGVVYQHSGALYRFNVTPP